MAGTRNRRMRNITENETVKAITELNQPKNTKKLKQFLGAIQYLAKIIPKLTERTEKLRGLLKKNTEWKWDEEKQKHFDEIKQFLTEKSCLAHYANDRENIKTSDASKTGLGITLWQKKN